jgi:hypothetical protein
MNYKYKLILEKLYFFNSWKSITEISVFARSQNRINIYCGSKNNYRDIFQIHYFIMILAIKNI